MKEFYTAKDLIEILDFSKNTIYKYLEEGKIKGNRVGKGGYRVPRAEVEKWLNQGRSKSVNRLTEVDEVEKETSRAEKRTIGRERDFNHWAELVNVGSKNKIDLFDGLVFLLTMMVSLAFFLLPIHFYQAKFKEILWLIYLFRVVFLLSGVLYLVVKIIEDKREKWYLMINFWLASMFLVLAIGSWQIGGNYGTVLYTSMSLVLLMRGFKRKCAPVVCFVCLLFMVGLGLNLISVLGNGQIMVILMDKWYLWVLAFLIPPLALIFALRSLKRDRKLFKGLLFLQGGIFLWLAMGMVGLGVWNEVFAYIVIGVMAFLFPFEEMFKMKVGRGKKRLLQAFIYAGAVLMIGGLAMAITRNVFRSMSKNDLLERSEIVMINTEEFFEHSKEELTVLAKNELLQNLMENEGGEESINELVKAVVDSSREIQLIGVYDQDGIMMTLYPYAVPSPVGVDFSLREYFERAKAGEVYVSNLIQLRLAGNPWATVVSAPVYNEEGKFIGIVAGSLDVDKLRDMIGVQQRTEEGATVVFDGDGRILVDTSGRWLYEEVGNKFEEILFEGVVIEHFNEEWDSDNGEYLELGIYRNIKDCNYGIVIEEPVEESEERMVEVLLPIIGMIMIVLFGGLGWILDKKNGSSNGEKLGKKSNKIGKNWEKK